MADHDDAPEKIKCLECGKEFSFLAPHLSKAHQMNARQYRERWGIPLHTPLASAEHSRQRRAFPPVSGKCFAPYPAGRNSPR